MKTLEEFEHFYNSYLKSQLEYFEKIRKILLSSVIVIGIASFISIVFYIYLLINLKFAIGPILVINIVLGLCIIAIVILYVYYKFFYEKLFKEKIISGIVSVIDSSLQYRSSEYADISNFIRSKFTSTMPDFYTGSDYVFGKIGDTKIEFSQVCSAYREGNKSYPIFKGLFFIADFNKNFEGTTLVLTDGEEKHIGHLASVIQTYDREFGNLVKLEDPEFESLFKVYSDNQITSRYILSTDLMRRMVEFRNKIGGDILFSFIDSNLYIAIPCSIHLFRPKLFNNLVDFKTVLAYYLYFKLFAGIVEDLNLNMRIWGKE